MDRALTAALCDATAEGWIRRLSAPLAAVAGSRSRSDERLRDRVVVSTSTTQQIAREDRELLATFQEVTIDAREIVTAHVGHLCAPGRRPPPPRMSGRFRR